MTTTTYERMSEGAALLRPVATDAYGRAFDPALPCHLPGCHPAGARCYHDPAAAIQANHDRLCRIGWPCKLGLGDPCSVTMTAPASLDAARGTAYRPNTPGPVYMT